MTALNRQELKEVLEEIFESRAHIDNKDHSDHHAWIQERIEAERERKRMYKVMTRTLVQWSIPFILSGAVYWLQTGSWPKP